MDEMKYKFGEKIIEAGQGLGERSFFTGWRSPSGGFHRVVSKSLPVRETLEEAQVDLDAFAQLKGLGVAR